jgi:hypothetical protein
MAAAAPQPRLRGSDGAAAGMRRVALGTVLVDQAAAVGGAPRPAGGPSGCLLVLELVGEGAKFSRARESQLPPPELAPGPGAGGRRAAGALPAVLVPGALGAGVPPAGGTPTDGAGNVGSGAVEKPKLPPLAPVGRSPEPLIFHPQFVCTQSRV